VLIIIFSGAAIKKNGFQWCSAKGNRKSSIKKGRHPGELFAPVFSARFNHEKPMT